MKALALDLCCGLGGWTNGLLAAGYRVIGYDVESWPGYKGELIQMDVRDFCAKDLRGLVTLVVASPPCQEFSYRSFPFKRCRELAANVPPSTDLWQACERIAKECNAPLIIENVRGAQKYMGKAAAHYGSFYLWNDVPPLLPIGRGLKGFQSNFKDNRKRNGLQRKGISKKQFAAQAAMIPIELSTWIGQCFFPRGKHD